MGALLMKFPASGAAPEEWSIVIVSLSMVPKNFLTGFIFDSPTLGFALQRAAN